MWDSGRVAVKDLCLAVNVIQPAITTITRTGRMKSFIADVTDHKYWQCAAYGLGVWGVSAKRVRF